MTHYCDVIMVAVASQITSLTIVYSTVYSDADQRKHQSSASLAFVWGIHRGLVNSPHKLPVTRKMFPFNDVIMAFTSTRPPLPAIDSNGGNADISVHHEKRARRLCVSSVFSGWHLCYIWCRFGVLFTHSDQMIQFDDIDLGLTLVKIIG